MKCAFHRWLSTALVTSSRPVCDVKRSWNEHLKFTKAVSGDDNCRLEAFIVSFCFGRGSFKLVLHLDCTSHRPGKDADYYYLILLGYTCWCYLHCKNRRAVMLMFRSDLSWVDSSRENNGEDVVGYGTHGSAGRFGKILEGFKVKGSYDSFLSGRRSNGFTIFDPYDPMWNSTKLSIEIHLGSEEFTQMILVDVFFSFFFWLYLAQDACVEEGATLERCFMPQTFATGKAS